MPDFVAQLFFSVVSADLIRILIDTMILMIVILGFCSALFLVTEIQTPDNTFEYCKKLNHIARIEWVTNLVLGISMIFCRYFVCGSLVFPFGVWHFFRHCQQGDHTFEPHEIHRKKSRDVHIRFYTFKLIFYCILFLTVMVYIGFGVLDYSLQFDWNQIMASATGNRFK